MAEVQVADMPYLTHLANQVKGLTPEEIYMIQQYTHHGDVIINARLLKQDIMKTYRENIYNPLEHAGGSFYCLFLLDLAPDALDYGPHLAKQLANDVNFMRYYKSDVYPKILIELNAGNIDYFRELTDKAIQRIITILAKRPPSDEIYTVYRGSSKKYLQEQRMELLELGSFQSTSIYPAVADLFAPINAPGRVIYKFTVTAGCICMYVEPITVHPGEFEILIAPGNRYVCIPNNRIPYPKDKNDACIIIPPEDVVKRMAAEGAATGAAAAGGGGGAADGAAAAAAADPAVQETLNVLKTNIQKEADAAQGGGSRRTRKRKSQKQSRSRRRQHKTRKQRGGAKIHLNPMNRWAVDPIFTRLDELSEDDLVLIAETLVKMNKQKQKKSSNSIFNLRG